MSDEQIREAIEVLLDAADEWSNYVDADHAPVSLRKYMEREAEQIISSLPVEVSTSADADAMNITHGESYGSDWVYPTDSSTAPGPAPQGVAEVMSSIDAYEATRTTRPRISYEAVEQALTAIITERDEWKERYLQVTAQTARVEDRVESLHASIATLRAEVEGQTALWHYGRPTLDRASVLALIDKMGGKV